MPRPNVSIALGCLIMLAFVVMANTFAQVQSLWTDETTQLSGIALPFGTQLHWLMGGANPILGVPPDRMPPLSYWIGSVWAKIFGVDEAPMRMLGILSGFLAAPALWLSARRVTANTTVSAPVFVLAVVYLAPGFITQTVEIRAYPIYFFWSAWSIWAFLRVLETPTTGRILTLIALSLGAIYTHYFGLVMSGTLWLTLLIAQISRPPHDRRIGAVFTGGVGTLVLSTGIVPFLMSALTMGGSGGGAGLHSSDALKDSGRLLFRLLFHATHLSNRVIVGAALLGMGLLFVLGIATIWRAKRDGTRPANIPNALYLLLPLAFAFVILPLMKLKVSNFDVLAPHYNLWMIPLVALFLAVPFSDARLWRGALAGVVLLLGSHLAADTVLMRHGSMYSHGPGDWVAAQVSNPDQTVVIHDANGAWATPYFTLYYRTHGAVTQVLRSPEQPDMQLLPGQSPQPVSSDFVAKFPNRLYLHTERRTSGELNRLLDSPGDCGVSAMPVFEGGDGHVVSRCAYDSATLVTVTGG